MNSAKTGNASDPGEVNKSRIKIKDSYSGDIIKEQICTVHYPLSRPIKCQVILTKSQIVLEEYDEFDLDRESDDDSSNNSCTSSNGYKEKYPVKDIFGFHIVQREVEEPSLTTVYACIILYSFEKGDVKTRSRIARVLEINESQHSYEENLNIAKEWALQIGTLLKLKYPKCFSCDFDSSHSNSLVDKIEKVFTEIKSLDRKKTSVKEPSSSDSIENDADDDNIVTEIDLEFDTATFSLVRSVLFNRRYLVIINPVSGQGKGLTLLEECILPVFADSGIEVELLQTKHSGHAHSYITQSDLSSFHAVVSVGGDGLLNEIVNGLRGKDSITNESGDGSQNFAKIPIGVVATGSGNGLARSIADYCKSSDEYTANPTLHSSLTVARGCVVPVNLTEASLDKKKLYSFLSVGWGIMSDIDIESEVLRSIGEIRFFIWSFVKLAKLRRYKAELSYIPYDSSGAVSSSRVIVDDEFVNVYSSCQSYIGSYMLFAPDAKQNDNTIHLAYLPSNTGRIATAKFLIKLDDGSGTHLKVNPVKYVKVKEFTLRCEGGIEGCLTLDGELVHAEEITVKVCDSPLYVLSMG